MFEVIIKGFSEEVKAMQMVESLNICKKAVAIFWRDFNLVFEETSLRRFVCRDD